MGNIECTGKEESVYSRSCVSQQEEKETLESTGDVFMNYKWLSWNLSPNYPTASNTFWGQEKRSQRIRGCLGCLGDHLSENEDKKGNRGVSKTLKPPNWNDTDVTALQSTGDAFTNHKWFSWNLSPNYPTALNIRFEIRKNGSQKIGNKRKLEMFRKPYIQ